MTVIRRRKSAPVFKGYTDEQGYKREGAPRRWPFGMARPFVSKAQPRIKRKVGS